MKYNTIILAICTAFSLAACQQKTNSDTSDAGEQANALTSLMLTTAPENPQTIAQVRQSVELGKSITLSGKVMGHKSPFIDGMAMMLIGDPDKLTSCDIKHGDRCTTPWDVCCDEPEDIKNFIATIQVLDANGELIKQGLKGTQGLKELSHVIITGEIAEGSNAENLLVNATGIYLKP